jgi:hypothetical protein
MNLSAPIFNASSFLRSEWEKTYRVFQCQRCDHSTKDRPLADTHYDLGTQSLGEQDGVVTQSTETNDTNLASLADVVSEKRRTRGNTGTQPGVESSSASV